ncbi:MAG TPA: hypothetical protein VGI93_03165 [Steroidobacteraceae bacterium]|jgi:uncharacterized lipoprotein
MKLNGLLMAALCVCLSGCHMLARFHSDCHHAQDYQRANSVSPLIVPEGMDKPNTQGALVIPTVELAPPPPGPKDACLDQPPRYKAAPPNKAASPSS